LARFAVKGFFTASRKTNRKGRKEFAKNAKKTLEQL